MPRPTTLLAFLLSASASLHSAVPAADVRNTETPDTDTHFTMPRYTSKAAWDQRRAQLRKQILFAAGLAPEPRRSPLNPEIFGRIERDGYSIEKVLLQTLPGYYLGGNLYRPLGRSGKFPAILSPHGHWRYGRLEADTLGSGPIRAINLAKQGYVVFAWDMVGVNDTVQTAHEFGGAREQLWSFGPLGLQLWNSIRSLDFVESLPDVDKSRIGMTGESGGGTQTFLLTAVDDRIVASVPVNMISAIMQGGSPCENAPGLRVGAFNVEIGAMMAPKPMLMIAATGDWTKNTPREEFPAVQGIYGLFGKADAVETIQIDAPHNYNQASREAMYRFFGRVLRRDPDASRIVEQPVGLERLQDMLALHGRTLPAGALTYEQFRDQWIAEAARQNWETAGKDAMRERLSLALGTRWPDSVESATEGDRIVLSSGAGDRVPGLYFKGSGTPLLGIDAGGADAAKQRPEIAAARKAGRPVLLIDAFQTGSAKAPRNSSHRYFTTFNRTESALRVQDILTALRFLDGAAATEISGWGQGAIWARFAAAVAPRPVRLRAPVRGFRGTDDEMIDQFFVPGIQRAGGLAAALALTGE